MVILGVNAYHRDASAAIVVDGQLVAAATASSEPIHQATGMCRKRVRIVLVGVTGLELRRSDFYGRAAIRRWGLAPGVSVLGAGSYATAASRRQARPPSASSRIPPRMRW